jgi:hypothetical protein
LVIVKIKARVKREPDARYANIDVNDLLIDQEHKLFHNVRGRIGVTTDLQQSLPKDGQIKRIQVMPHPKMEGKYIVLDGHRRTVAARKAGLETMKVEIVDIGLEQVTKFMLLSAMREEIPDIALDSDGNVVGGYCYAVNDLVSQGMKRFEIARLTGLKPDTISALKDLYSEPVVGVRQAVAQGRIGITAYWRIRRLPDSDKEEILSLRGQITRKKIERFLQDKNDAAAAEMAAAEKSEQAEAELDLFPEIEEEYPSGQVSAKMEFVRGRYSDDRTVAGLLSEALALVKRASGMDMTPDGRHVANQLRSLVEQL